MKPLRILASLFSLALFADLASGQIPSITSIGGEQYISSAYMEHPSVDTDSKAQPHFVCDLGVGGSFMKFHRVKDKWTGGVFATGSRGGRYDASRLYIGQIEIDSKDRAWISCKLGVKEYGGMYGQGLWLFRDVATRSYPIEQFFRFVCVYKGMGLVSTDAKYPNEGVMLGTFGNWEKLNDYGSTLGKGSLGLGNGGEKVRFKIASYAPRFDAAPGRSYADGVWHTAMNGFSALSSQYQNSLRYKAGQGPVTWAEYRSYSRMSDDYCHPGIGVDLDDPRIAYMGSVYGSGSLCINVWDGNRMLFNPYALKVLDYDATFGSREGVRFAPVPTGGTFVFWGADGNVIKMCYLSQNGVSTPPSIIATGRSPGVATDRFGNIHLVYYNRGICYRKIQVSILQGIEPRNRVEKTRVPRFRWTSTKAAAYTLEITHDGIKQTPHVSSSNSWRPPADLAVGNYAWRVKEGKPDNPGRWTKSIAFQIPPAVPAPETPSTRLPDAPVRPTFQWTANDPKANQYSLQLFKQGDLVETLTATGHVTSARWTARLGAGGYTWRIKAVRYLKDHVVASDWSPAVGFQVAVPGACAFTKPSRLETFEPGWQTVTCAWTEAEGADGYNLKVVYNGELLEKIEDRLQTHYPLVKAFQPGYYSLFVQSVNTYGNGPWSPVRTFIVSRDMTPGNDRTLAGPPRGFEWTRSKGAARYLVKLARYDKALQKFVPLREVWTPQPAGGITPRWTPAITLTSGAYRWSVTDYIGKKAGYTSVDYFQIRTPGMPRAVSPVGAVAGHRQMGFTWGDPSGFGEEFEAQVWKNGDQVFALDWTAAQSLLDDGGLFTKTWSFGDTDGGTYTWRVRSRNDSGSGPWAQESFTLTPLAAPTLTEPLDDAEGEVGVGQPVTWEAVPNASHYGVLVLQGTQTLAAEDLEGTNWLWTPDAAGTYTIQVRAGETGWSRWTSRTLTVP